MPNRLLARGYRVTGTCTSSGRVKELAGSITEWEPTSSPGREAATVPAPVALARYPLAREPTRQYAVRTPSKDRAGGSDYAVLATTRTERDMLATVLAYDQRAGMESQLKEDKHGPGLAAIRKRRLPAQKLVALLAELAGAPWANLPIWARRWLAPAAPRLAELGVVRLVREVWAAPGRVWLSDEGAPAVRLQPDHPRARDLTSALHALLPSATP